MSTDRSELEQATYIVWVDRLSEGYRPTAFASAEEATHWLLDGQACGGVPCVITGCQRGCPRDGIGAPCIHELDAEELAAVARTLLAAEEEVGRLREELARTKRGLIPTRTNPTITLEATA